MAQGSTILVIDDNHSLRQGMLDILTYLGYHGVGAADGYSGLQLAEDVQPDLIMLDVIMPGMDGWSVLKTLQSQPATRHIPVLLLTGLDVGQMPISSTEFGAVEYVRKPFAIVDLLAIIDTQLRAVQAV